MMNGYDLIGVVIICLTVVIVNCAGKNTKFSIDWIVPVSFFAAVAYAVVELAS